MGNMLMWLIILAVLFVLVIWNNKRNIRKKRNLKTRTFKQDYYARKKELDKEKD